MFTVLLPVADGFASFDIRVWNEASSYACAPVVADPYLHASTSRVAFLDVLFFFPVFYLST